MHRAGDLLSLDTDGRENRLVRLDVRVKLVVAVATILAVVMSTRVGLPILVFAGCVAFWVVWRAPLRAVLIRLVVPLGLAVIACLLRALLTGTTPIWSFRLGPWQLTASYEGFWEGLLIGSRVLGSVGVLIVLCLVTPTDRVFSALRWAKAPRTLVELAVLMYRYLFAMHEQAQNVLAAQRIRLGYGTVRGSIASAANLAGIVMLRSLDQAEKSHEAMVARGYEQSLHVPPLPGMRLKDVAATMAAVAIVAVLYFAAERGML